MKLDERIDWFCRLRSFIRIAFGNTKTIEELNLRNGFLNVLDVTIDELMKKQEKEHARGNLEERPHGEWLPVDIGEWVFRCSLCHDVSTFESKFCGNCGADMRKEGEAE